MSEPSQQAPDASTAATPAAPADTGDRSRSVEPALVAWMLLLTGLWGLNAVSIKVLLGGIAPIMGAGLRNVLALGVLTAFGLWRGHDFRYRGAVALHSVGNALLFTAEFVCSYSGAQLTNAGHFSLFINCSPFIVALGAHFIFPLDRLHTWKVLGLVAAFSGLVLMFSDDLFLRREGFWRGDLLVLAAACFWGLNTLQAKRFILGHMSAFQLIYIKVLVSTPILLALSHWWEPAPFRNFSLVTAAMLGFQGLVVVSFSYQMLSVLLERYHATAVQSFAFLTPVWGVVLGIVVLGERFTVLLGGGMALVALGLFVVSRPRTHLPGA